jgi:hypothetical protein
MLRQTIESVPEWTRRGCYPFNDPTRALLDLIGPVEGLHVLLVGPGGLEIMCALMARGCASVEMASLAQRPRAEIADLAIVPDVASIECAAQAVVQARRALRPLNTLILRFKANPPASLLQDVRILLGQNGFFVGRQRSLDDRIVLTAEFPLYGRLACA